MRFCKLRIAWSVTCLVACALLIVLWVRSYSTVDSLRCPAFGRYLVHIQSGSGRIIVFTLPYSNEWQTGSIPIEHIGRRDVLTTAVFGTPYRPKVYVGFSRSVAVPYWALLLPTVAAVVLSLWSLHETSWRFSLRTLLIATTLVAAVLGLIVWVAR
jgi:hypothetical protein